MQDSESNQPKASIITNLAGYGVEIDILDPPHGTAPIVHPGAAKTYTDRRTESELLSYDG
ncbi:hypothetical protein ONS95_014065 [Cadophora gregata]|uniref:uncharacterized protein n=1 Tax=Cadophora gregata TaxID=51156 RepID=UPI0026DB486F|nr:uncharacterized protein ONS95_014065 [Cadophora gregata]KAK0113817.1 hypothetical protein ONS96_014671 [Cadophora gregata f. sp. sojae]KAK0114577.1 hypothetical protein ONS95_014065 [Cadophora gregata]